MLTLVVAAGWAVPAGAQVRTDERVDVARVLVDVRVTDNRGRPVHGLSASDFRVDIDGRRARVESALWVGLSRRPGGQEGTGGSMPPQAGVAAPVGRLTVFMFQNSLDRSRIGGLLQMMRHSARFVDRFGPGDQGAVVVFDSRLRVWQDFTSDRKRLAEVLGRSVMFEQPHAEVSETVSLTASLDRSAAEHAASTEAALKVLAAALGRIEGPKSLVIFGHGFGTFMPSPGSLTGLAVLDRDYEEARAALIAARVTVFAMDVTDADTHTLETGLMTAAEETGGFYVKANEWQSVAMDRLEGALDGYYVLSAERPVPTGGRHTIHVRTGAPHATVSARRYYID